MRDGATAGGYRMPRVSYYLGRWIRGTDWYPDYQLRLYDRRVGRFNGKRVHESVELKQGRPGTLAARPAALPLSRHLGSRHEHRSLHDARRRGVVRRGPAHQSARSRDAPAGGVPAQLHRPPRLSRRHGRLPDLDPQLVLRLPEDPEALGAAARASGRRASATRPARAARAAARSSPERQTSKAEPRRQRQPAVSRSRDSVPCRRSALPQPVSPPPAAPPSAVDVLAPHRHGANVAWWSESGARHRPGAARRSAIGRCSWRTRAASCGSARRRGST